MGFYFRKSVRLGPLRFNLSKSGIGTSVGVKGFRFGAGPRGNYVRMGANGIYFRHTFNPPKSKGAASHPPLELNPRGEGQGLDYTYPGTVGPMVEIESGDALAMVDSSSQAMLQELNAKINALSLVPLAWVLGTSCFLFMASSMPSPAGFIGLGVMGLLVGLTYFFDASRKAIVLLYEMEDSWHQAYQTFHDAFHQLRSSSGIWHFASSGKVLDRKYHAGADSVVRRAKTTPTSGDPPHIKTNIEVPILPVGRQRLVFLPDRVIVLDGKRAGAVDYKDLVIEVGTTQFIEEGSVPPDAPLVDRTWKYVNKKGGPDRRFKDNRELPVMRYEEIHFKSAAGLNELVVVSKPGVGKLVKSALAALARQPHVIANEALLV